MCEVGCADDGDFEGSRSDIMHHYDLSSYLVEGRSLQSGRAFPAKAERILYSVFDIHTGDEIYHIHHAQGRVDSEPDLKTLTSDMVRPYLILNWLVVR